MSRARKISRPVPPPTPEQLAKWRRLVELARNQTDSPLAKLGLSGVAHQLAKAPMPLDQRKVGSALHRLVEEARRFESYGAAHRMERAEALRRLADAASASVGAPDAAQARAPRFRADLDG